MSKIVTAIIKTKQTTNKKPGWERTKTGRNFELF
jgi:hypothetical protein